MSSDKDDGRFCGEALRNPLILHEVFKNLPTSLLLSSVSLVNKNWNREARTYIRDGRLCSPSFDFNISGACEFLAKFSQLCQQVTDAGRVIPWNRFRIHFSHSRPSCMEESSEEIFRGLSQSELRLRHLVIYWGWTRSDCPFHKPLLNLLCHKSIDIQTLKIKELTPSLREAFCTEHLQFPRLEEIMFSTETACNEDSSDEERVVARIFAAAPKLDRIICGDSQSLRVVPEEYYGLLHHFVFDFRSIENTSFYRGILQRAARLRKVTLLISPDVYKEPEDRNLRQAAEVTLGLLLQSRGPALKEICIYYPCPLGQLHFPPLVSLTKLELSSMYVLNVGEFWNKVVSLNISKNMPGLKAVEMDMWLSSHTIFPMGDSLPLQLVSNSVRELTLLFRAGKINILLFKSAFPQITRLNLVLSHVEPVPFSEIWGLWPHLEQLQVRGVYNLLKRNYDADFCGVFPEEAAQLEKEDEDYLKAVHIVPIRPSLLTMHNVRKLGIDLTFGQTSKNTEGYPHVFISKVTQLVVLSKLTSSDISVNWTCGSTESEDEFHEILTR